MGAIEKTAKKRKQRQDVQGAVLSTLGIAGTLAVVVIAPKAVSLFAHSIISPQYERRTKSALLRLSEKGLVEFSEVRGNRYARLTKRGEEVFALEQEKRSLQSTTKKRWDGQWRMVIFDIPESRRLVRVHLRSVMQEVGFYKLQNSVWVFPYDCEELIALLKVELKTGKDVLYAVVSVIENDKAIRAHFKLPLA